MVFLAQPLFLYSALVAFFWFLFIIALLHYANQSRFETTPGSLPLKDLSLCSGLDEGRARTQSPTITNYAPEFPTLGGIAGFNPAGVQWKGLDLGELPCWSQYPLSQVSMLQTAFCLVLLTIRDNRPWATWLSFFFRKLSFFHLKMTKEVVRILSCKSKQ